jgi:hypothetical protein
MNRAPSSSFFVGSLISSSLAASFAASLLVGCTDEPKPGPYELVSTVDMSSEAISPRQIDDVVSTLRTFSMNPAATLIGLADQARDPAITTLRSEVATTLLARLPGWINEEVQKVTLGGKTLPAFADQVAMLARTSLTRFAIHSELTLDGGAPTHRIVGLDMSPAGVDAKVAFEAVDGESFDQAPETTVGADGSLTLGDQRFTVAYGQHAWEGIDAAATQLVGDAVRPALGAAVNCPAVAKVIAARCLLAVCVNHEDVVRDLCESSLDRLVASVRDKLADVRLDSLHFSQGTARVVDVDGDGVGDEIADGVWTAELDLGSGLGVHAATAQFSGAR